MGIGAKFLRVWTQEMEEEPTDPSCLPTPSQVLYAHPNPDNSSKKCSNCVSYATQQRSCFIHAPDLKIKDSSICGYHVFGEPTDRFESRRPMDPVDPVFSGLVSTADGTYCAICKYFNQNVCHGVQEDGAYLVVDAMACCARWEPRE